MSTLKADTIQSTGGGAATLTKQSAAKAFVNFIKTARHLSAQVIQLNISSIADTGLQEIFKRNTY